MNRIGTWKFKDKDVPIYGSGDVPRGFLYFMSANKMSVTPPYIDDIPGKIYFDEKEYYHSYDSGDKAKPKENE
jgi:hypothetical protein